MSKVSGLGWTAFTVADSGGTPRAILNDFTDVKFATPRAVQDITGLDKSAIERLLLLADMSVTINGVFDPAANAAHDVFKTVSSTSVARATTITTNGKNLIANIFYTDYPITRAPGGELTYSVPGVLADGAVPTWS